MHEITLICFKYNSFCFQNVSKNVHEYISIENISYKSAWNHSKNGLNRFKYNIFFFFFQKNSSIFKDGKPKL